MPSRPKRAPKWIGRDNNREARIQAACVEYARLVLPPECLVFHVPNGGPGRSLARLVWIGMVPGVPDIVIIDEHALAYLIEIKPVDGVLTKVQKDMRDYCLRTKKPWALVHDVTEMHAAMVKFGLTMRSHKLQ